MPKIHHSAICTADIETSLRFWRDGLGFTVTMDHAFDGDWPTLFDAPTNRLRSIFLSDEPSDDGGVVELVEFEDWDEAPGRSAAPSPGFFLLSVNTDVEAALARLADLGLGGTPRRISVPPGVSMALVIDPNGVPVELIDLAAVGDIASVGIDDAKSG